MIYARRRSRRDHAQHSDRPSRARKFCLDDEEVWTWPATPSDRGALFEARRPADADGHRMGEGRRGRAALYRPGAARDRRLAAASADVSRPIASRKARRSGQGQGGRRTRSRPGSARVIDDERISQLSARAKSWSRHDLARLGAGDEIGRRRSSPTAAAAPVMPPLSRASSAFRRSSAPTAATAQSHDRRAVTLSCAEGETGSVYEGEIAVRVEARRSRQLPRPKTHIMVNLGNPDLAFRSRCCRTTASASRAWNSSSASISASSDGAGPSREVAMRPSAREDRRA